MTFDLEFEEHILARALRDVDYLKRAARLLDIHHFNTEHHAWVWKQARDVWDRYREHATPKLLLTRARADYPDEDERATALSLVKKLYKTKADAPHAALEELEKFVRAVNAQLTLERAATALEKGDVEEVYTALRQLTKKDIRARDYTHGRWIEEFEIRQRDRRYRRDNPDEFTRIPTGFKRLDRVIDGLELGELGLVLATTGKGKSITLLNMFYNCVKVGYPAVYFTLEMPERQISQRMDSRWLRIPYNKFKRYDFTEREEVQIERRLKKARKHFRNKAHVIELPLRKATIDSVRGALDDLQTDLGFRPKAIFLDSADHLRGTSKFESYRLEQSEVYWDCAALAQEGYAVWSSTHAGRDWAKRIVEAEGTGESYDKARIADLVMSLNTPERKTRSTVTVDDDDDDDEEAKPAVRGKYLELFLAKYRDGDSMLSIPLDGEFSTMFIRELEEGDDEEEDKE